METNESGGKAENDRQYGVVDQMLTMHAILQQRMERRAFWLNTVLMALAVFLTVCGFIGDDVLVRAGVNSEQGRIGMGLVSLAVLICSIAEYRVNWSKIAGAHENAVMKLAALKGEFRRTFAETGGNDPKENDRLTVEYEKVMEVIPVIPERWFASLKAEHQFKRIVSQRISENPKCPVACLRLRIRCEGIWHAIRGKSQ